MTDQLSQLRGEEATLATDVGQIVNYVQALHQQVADLQARASAGASGADLSPDISSLQQAIGQLSAILPDPATQAGNSGAAPATG